METFLVLVPIAVLCVHASSFICNTPDLWLGTEFGYPHCPFPYPLTPPPPSFMRFRRSTPVLEVVPCVANVARIWLTGIVPYKLNDSLSLDDIIEVKEAIDEYHQKTCIRFEPWTYGMDDFVSIELDDNFCGIAQVGKMGGYQFARFGGFCRNKATMIHELGHTLSLGHEHQRKDRDNFLNYKNCTGRPKKLSPFSFKIYGMYDYASQMHYECNVTDACSHGGWPTQPNVLKCGSETNNGLSVLDVDNINSLYHCQGCYRHRWRPAEYLTYNDKANLYSFGFKTRHGSSLIPCRGRILGSILAGKFNYRRNTCIVAHNVTIYEITKDFEVLTIPGGLSDQCSVYKLVDHKEATLKTAVPAGDWINDYDWRSFIAYASITAEDGVTEGSVGTVWVNVGWKGFQNNAEVSDSTKGVVATNYQVLTCSLDTKCILKHWWLVHNTH